MSQKVRLALCSFGFLLLGACSNLPSGGDAAEVADLPAENAAAPELAAPSEESRLVLETIAFLQRVASASADEQRREVAAASKAFSRERSTALRLRYGALLSLPGQAGGPDAQKALVTLEPLSTAGSIGPVRQLATLLILQINERLKEQRRAQQFKEQLDESRANERGLNERVAQMKNQLDELRAIERALIERGRPAK